MSIKSSKFKHPLTSSSWDESEINSIYKVIHSNKFTMGKFVEKFEKKFSKYIGRKYSVMVNSGSSANLLMIASLFYRRENRLKRGDEIIVPAVSWSTTYFPLYQYGLKLKFVDIDLHTLNYDLEKLQLAINKKTRLLMVVNLLGNPNNFDIINQLIKGKNIDLIEDNCESLGAEFKGKKAGSFGLMGSFSSYYSHHINTIEGGIITTDNNELYNILLSLRSHGWTRDLSNKNYFSKQQIKDPFYNFFNFVLPGYNLRPIEICGSIGLEQVKKLPKIIAGRRKNSKLFKKYLSNHSDLIIQSEIGKSSWFGFSLVIRPESNLKRSILLMKLKKLGFEYRPIVAGNFVKSESFKYLQSEISNNLNNAQHIHQKGVYIGNHHRPLDEVIVKLKTI